MIAAKRLPRTAKAAKSVAVAAVVAVVDTWGYGITSPGTLFTVAGVLLLSIGLGARWLARPLDAIS